MRLGGLRGGKTPRTNLDTGNRKGHWHRCPVGTELAGRALARALGRLILWAPPPPPTSDLCRRTRGTPVGVGCCCRASRTESALARGTRAPKGAHGTSGSSKGPQGSWRWGAPRGRGGGVNAGPAGRFHVPHVSFASVPLGAPLRPPPGSEGSSPHV